MRNLCLLSLCVILSSSVCSARDITLTVKLGAGRSECFYDYIHEGAFLEIEYQVYIPPYRFNQTKYYRYDQPKYGSSAIFDSGSQVFGLEQWLSICIPFPRPNTQLP